MVVCGTEFLVVFFLDMLTLANEMARLSQNNGA